jgi:hypothetical protein
MEPSFCSTKSAARQAAELEKDEAILAMVVQLAMLYWRPDYTPGQAKQVYATYLEDLRDYSLAAIRRAVTAYRRDPANKFFPHPGALRGLIEEPDAFHFSGRAAWKATQRREAERELVGLEAVHRKQLGAPQ